jgi:HAD superfamily hydrolase (TIGR01509 family)
VTIPVQPVLQAVVFDLDGLMFNTEELHDEVGEILLQRRGCHFSQVLKREIMGRPARVTFQIMIDRHGLNATVEQLQAESEELFAELLPAHLRPLRGLTGLLAGLESAQIPKAIATSSGRSYTAMVLSQVGFQERFQFALTGEDVREGKPAPEVYLTAARRLGIPPAAVMVLEDSENGCRAGVAAGAFTVAVPGPHSRDHDFAGVALVADSLADARIYRALRLQPPV